MFSLQGQAYALNRSNNRVLRVTSTGSWEYTAASVPARLLNAERESCTYTWTEDRPGLDPNSPCIDGRAYLYHLTQGSLFAIDKHLTFTVMGTGPSATRGVIAATQTHVYLILLNNSSSSLVCHSKVHLYDIEQRGFVSTNIDIQGMPVYSHTFDDTVLLLVMRRSTRSELGVLKLFKRGNKITVNELIVEDPECDLYHMTVNFQHRYVLIFFQRNGKEFIRIYDSVSEVFITTQTNIRPSLFTDVVGVVHKNLFRIIMRTGSIDLPEEVISILYSISTHGNVTFDSFPLPQAEFHASGDQPTTPRALLSKNPLAMINGSVSVSNVPIVDGVVSKSPSKRASSSQRPSTPTMKYTLNCQSPSQGSRTRNQARTSSTVRSTASPSASVPRVVMSGRQGKGDAGLGQGLFSPSIHALEQEIAFIKGRNVQLEQEVKDNRSEILDLKAQVIFLSDTVEELKRAVKNSAH